jgi:hypothetical protein
MRGTSLTVDALRGAARPGAFTRGILAACLFLSASLAFGQAADGPEFTTRRLLLAVSKAQDSAISDNDLLLLSRSILVRLQQASAELVVVEGVGEGDDDEALGSRATAAGADGWIRVRVSGDWASLGLEVASFDMLSSETVMDATFRREGWASAQNLSMETWSDVTGPIAGHYRLIVASSTPSTERVARLTVTALPGTVISGLDGGEQTVDESGTASWSLGVPRQYTLRAKLPGRLFVTQTILLASDRDLALEQPQEPRWTTELSLSDLSYLGAAVTLSAKDRYVYTRLGFTTYLLDLTLGSDGVFVSQPLTSLFLQLGAYFFRGLGPVDGYLAIEPFLRVVHESGAPLALEPLSSWGIRWIVGAELALPGGAKLFFEYTPTDYVTSFPTLFKASLGSDTPAGWRFNESDALLLLSARMGLRWKL